MVNGRTASVATGDIVNFALIAASSDTNRQKSLQFALLTSGWNNNRSKIEIPAGLGFEAIGTVSSPTIVTMLPTGGTYYTFVDSGSFNVSYASFTFMDENGIQLAGNGSLFAISHTTFDYLGSGVGSTSTLITVNGVQNSTITLVDVTYSSTTGNKYNYNYTILNSSDGLQWSNLSYSGQLSGASNSFNDKLQQHVLWKPFTPAVLTPSILDVKVSSITAKWGMNGNDAGIQYELDASSASYVAGTVVSSITYLSTATVGVSGTPLLPDTTYQLRASAMEGGLTSPYAPLGSTSTWTSALQNVQDLVYTTSITVEWTAFTTGSGAGTGEGYRLEASTTNFNGTGTVYYSSTTDVTQSTLTVAGLDTATTYDLRAGALNHNQVPNWTWTASIITGAGAAPANVVMNPVFVSSMTVTWTPVSSYNGYSLEAYSDAGYGSLVTSSVTASARWGH